MAGQGNFPFQSAWLYSKGKGKGKGKGNASLFYNTVSDASKGDASVTKTIFSDWFFEASAPPGSTGQVKIWNGSAWVAKPVKIWSGSAWVVKPAKYWNGASWVVTPY